MPETVAPRQPPTKAERAAKVSGIVVNPARAIQLQSQQPMVFTGIPVDDRGNVIHGLAAEWESADKGVLFIRKDGQAVAGKPGRTQLTATAGNKREVVQVTVVEGPKERFGGRKENSSRRRPQPAERRGGAVRTVKAVWDRGENAFAPQARRAAGAAAFAPVALRLPDPNIDPLPDNESGSLYTSNNNVGSPPGQTEPGAPNTPAPLPIQETPGSANFNFDIPVAQLPGRGIHVQLGLVYNSRVWHKSTDPFSGENFLTYDVDSGWPAPGFRLGYGQMETQGSFGVTLTDPDGTRHELIKVNPFNQYDYTYETDDGSYIRFYGGRGWGSAYYTDGSRIDYGAAGSGYRSYPTKITDRNGNYILISYVGGVGPRISSIQDTMNRFVRFHYDGAGDLVAATVPGYAGGPDRQTARLYYQDIAVSTSFQVGASAPPTARVVRYAYLPDTGLGYRFDYSAYGMIRQIVKFRQMSVNYLGLDQTGAVAGEGQWSAQVTYDYPAGPANLPDVPKYGTRTEDWAGRTSAVPVYSFSFDEAQGVSTVASPDGTVSETRTNVSPGAWDDGLVQETLVRQGAGGPVLSRKSMQWEHDGTSRNPRLRQLRETNEANQTRTTIYGYTTYNNLASVAEHGFDNPDGSVGPELRRIETTYQTQAQWTNRRLLRLPTSQRVIANGAVVARVDYAYDTAGTNLAPRDDIVMHDPAFNPHAPVEEICNWECSYYDEWGNCYWQWVCYPYTPYDASTDYRGNLTSATWYADAANAAGAVTRTYSFDIAGNSVAASTSCCRDKAFHFAKAYEYAYVTSEERGPTPGQFVTGATFDYNTGLIRTATDENGQTTTIHYYPSSLRHYRTELPNGGYAYTEYGDGLYADPDASRMHSYIAVTKALDPGREVRRWQFRDGRGHLARTFGYYTSQGHEQTVVIEYDVMGRVSRSSNPYYTPTGSNHPVNPSGQWTTYQYDLLGRTTSVTTPDGAVKRWDYQGSVATVTDEAGKSRRQLADALGRVARVDEPDASGNLGPVGAPAQPTSYGYDGLDHLVHVAQGAQHRYFKYDGLSRLTHERQVEQDAPHYEPDPLTGNSYWSRRLTYNAQGFVHETFDARGVRMLFSYDGINRPTHVSFSDSTPALTYTYDQARPGYFNRGRLTQLTTAATNSAPQTVLEFDYDRVGHTAAHRQTVGASTYSMAYAYNYHGLLTSQTYPSGRVVSYAYDAAARVASVSDGARTYASNMDYYAHGGMSAETFGNGAVHGVSYNSRLQMSRIDLAKDGAVVQRYDYKFGQLDPNTGAVDETKNNGRIALVEGFIGGSVAAPHRQWQQRASYDHLGRLSLFAEHRGDTSELTYSAHYTYDQYGNRYQSGGQNYGLNFVPVEGGQINQNNNRFVSTGSYTMAYDAAGNLTQDGKFRGMHYAYDANGRQTVAWRPGAETGSSSVYDGSGQRVQVKVADTARHYVYDVAGKLVSEYGPGGWERDNIYRAGILLAVNEAGTACSKSVYQFISSFYQGALGRQPGASEMPYWHGRLVRAQASSYVELMAEAQALGEALFTSSEYQSRNRSDRDYVSDLYWAYLQRAPTRAGGITGRAPCRRAGARTCGAASPSAPSFRTASTASARRPARAASATC